MVIGEYDTELAAEEKQTNKDRKRSRRKTTEAKSHKNNAGNPVKDVSPINDHITIPICVALTLIIHT